MPFVVDGSTDLVLMSHVDRLELRVTTPEVSITARKCPYVVSVIKEAIEHLKSCHKYMKFNNSLGFYCPSDLEVESGTPHHAVCLETAAPEACWNQVSPEYMKCRSKCAQRLSKLLAKHKVWFVQVYTFIYAMHEHTHIHVYVQQ